MRLLKKKIRHLKPPHPPHHCNQARFFSSHFGHCEEVEAACDAASERTTPILFAHGPWYSAWAWRSTMQRLAKLGFTRYDFLGGNT